MAAPSISHTVIGLRSDSEDAVASRQDLRSPVAMRVRKIPTPLASKVGFCGGLPCGLTSTATEDKSVEERAVARRKLTMAIGLSLCFMVLEIIGGVFSNSLAIMTDAAHLLSDVASFAISLFALWMAGWEATPRHSFGYHRMEILGALISMQLIWMITGILLYEAVTRMISNQVEVDGRLMFITAAFGVAVNICLSVLLGHDHGHSHGHGHSHDHGGILEGIFGHSHSHDHEHDDEHDHDHSRSLTNGHDHSHDHDHGHDHDHNSTHAEGSRQHSHVSECPASLHKTAESLRHKHKEEVEDGDPHMPLLTSTASDSCICVVVPEEADACAGGKQKEGNINMRGAYLHALGDLIQSVGVMIGGAAIWYNPEWKVVDLICTLLFSAMVLFTTFGMLRDVMDVLMESTPRHINADEVREGLQQVEGVLDVHELHIWAITLGKVVLACHVKINSQSTAEVVLQQVLEFCQSKYGISHATIQVETHCHCDHDHDHEHAHDQAHNHAHEHH